MTAGLKTRSKVEQSESADGLRRIVLWENDSWACYVADAPAHISADGSKKWDGDYRGLITGLSRAQTWLDPS